jgi:hypothetical protein
LYKPTESVDDEYFDNFSIKNPSHINKVYLQGINDIEEFYFILELGPHMKYFKVQRINNMDIQLFVRTSLKKINDSGDSSLHSFPSRLSPTKSAGTPCRDSLGSCIFQGLPKTPRGAPKIFKNLNFSGDSNGGFLESPDNTHQLPGESLNPS